MLLRENWLIRSSADVDDSGEAVSSPTYDAKDWQPASVPTTVLAALVKNGAYGDLYFSKNLEEIPTEQFEHAWWYRTEFALEDDGRFEHARLAFDGINYRANVWLNGERVASCDSIVGAFRRFELDITKLARDGTNVLAVEVFPPRPGDFTVGFVDWNPSPPDSNMGIWREVRVLRSGAVSISDPFVESKVNLETLAQAALTVTADLVNHGDGPVSGTLKGEIEGSEFSREVSLAPGERKRVRFSPDQFPQLNLSPARLWWPNNLGEPNLYELKLSFAIDNRTSDEQTVRFGIREVSDYITEDGHRGYMINGQKVLIRGGGWVDDLLLADDTRRLEAQVRYTKHMNLNTIRLEGFWGSSQELYDLCDEHGLLLMVGWSCHWEWESYVGKPEDEFGCITTDEDMDLIARSWKDQVVWLRNHPSIFVWFVGSDKLPRPELERKYIEVLDECDATRAYLAAAKNLESEVSGFTGVKMSGPYAYVPPVYWYVDTSYGGAFGFNTETGPGAQPPPLEGLKRMIPEDHLWPPDDYWDYHCARREFGSIKRYERTLNARYGAPQDVSEFARTAQLVNYEAMRAMFEAFGANKGKATGVIQWMLNSAWPKMYWQLYDYYLMPNGAFYGARKACEPIHILYDYGDHDVCVVNDTFAPLENLRAEVRILTMSSREVFAETAAVSVAANASARVMHVPDVAGLSTTYFLDLRLTDRNGQQVSDNFYWLSTKEDILDVEKTEWFVTPIKEHADLTGLRDLPEAAVKVQHKWEHAGDERTVRVTLENPTDRIAFGVELVVAGKRSGAWVLPVYWDDNYMSLLPGETREVTASFSASDLNGDEPVLKVSGWNVAPQ